jgi:hypothetical protein
MEMLVIFAELIKTNNKQINLTFILMKYFLYLIAFGSLIAANLLMGCEPKNEKSNESTAMKDSADVVTALNRDNEDNFTGGTYFKYAHSYNNFIIANQGYILEDNIQFIKAVKKEESKEKVTELYNKLMEDTKMSIDTMKTLCSFNGNEKFKRAGIELFEFYKEAWEDYKPLLSMKDKKERAKVVEDLKIRFNDKHSVKEKKLEEEFMKAHTAFANEYNLHTRSTALHEELDSMLYLK